MSRDSFLKKANPTTSNAYRRSPKQEKELAKRGKGKLVPGSGSSYQKGDVKKFNGILRIEAKTTERKSFSVTREMIHKVENAALPNDELPAIVIEFLDENGEPEHEVAVVPMYVLENLYE